ncbi:hypothetical protein PTW37_17370 (plasmid) [Arthrobacter agilis]|nr:hypothetical protein [Arthrobacter agilis]WDF35167.1 hypothetical protein PTW37_17370 [Arthrobacter agilis]
MSQSRSRCQEGVAQASGFFLLSLVEVPHNTASDGLKGSWFVVEEDVRQLVSEIAVLTRSFMDGIMHDHHSDRGADGKCRPGVRMAYQDL